MRWKSLLRGDDPLPIEESRKGHLIGGPSRRSALLGRSFLPLGLLLTLSLLTGCSSGGSGGETRRPSPQRSAAVIHPLNVYRELGLMAGTEEFPAVASFSMLAGPADSTYVLFGLSLPNNALMFQREGSSGFVGRYGVSLTFMKDGEVVLRAGGEEEVRVPSFSETSRTDESVVYQTLVTLEPGEYEVEVEARDVSVATKRVTTKDTILVPSYSEGGRRLADPIFVYRADGRQSSSELPGLIVNPRHTIPYGTESLLLYLEGYGLEEDEKISLRVFSQDDEEVWETEVGLTRSDSLIPHALVELPGEDLPLGQLWVEARIGEDSLAPGVRSPLVITVSDQWMVANFDEMLEFLGYIATQAELDSLEAATPSERAQLWDDFWARRDPEGASGMNLFRENFFERLRLASLYFAEPGRPGWKTDRGEVFIVLGRPDYIVDRYLQSGTARPDAYDWVYENSPSGRLILTFTDRYNTDRFELTPASRVAFRSTANLLRSRYR